MGVPAASADVPTLVYIVVDDDAVRSALSLLVRTCGWNARALASRKELHAALAKARPACIVLDLDRPHRNGATLQHEISRLEPDVPVIVVTAFEDHPLAGRAVADGATAVVAKPFRGDELIKAISRVITPSV